MLRKEDQLIPNIDNISFGTTSSRSARVKSSSTFARNLAVESLSVAGTLFWDKLLGVGTQEERIQSIWWVFDSNRIGLREHYETVPFQQGHCHLIYPHH